MNCENCGAPMRLVPGHDYFVCDYCASLYFPHESADGVRVLDERSHLACPICGESLVSAVVQDVRVLHCKRCKGILVAQAAFRTVLEFLRRDAPEAVTPPVALNRAELQRRVSCPSCHAAMETHPYYGPGNIVVDNCGSCSLLWLDYGELARVGNALWYDRLLRL